MARNFDEILANITLGNGGHTKEGQYIADDIGEEIGSLSINPITRKIIVPAGFDTVIAVTNDYNSNEMTFVVPSSIDGHDITACQKKVVKWLNSQSKERGYSELRVEKEEEGNLVLTWVIPPEATTAAGALQLAICFCDLDHQDRVIYKWNSLVSKDFSVAQGLDEVAVQGTALSKIITLDLYSRQFSLPSEFNKTIAYVGDSFANTLTFRLDRYLNGADFYKSAILIKYTTPDGNVYESTSISSKTLLESLDGNDINDLIEFSWDVPPTLTSSAGTVELVLSLLVEGEHNILWNSAPLKGLSIGEGYVSEVVPDSGEGELKLINKTDFLALLEREYGYEY